MTKEEVKKYCDILIEEMTPLMRQNVERLLDTNVIDVEKYDTNYLVPKMVMSAVCDKMSRELTPPMAKDQKAFKALKKAL